MFTKFKLKSKINFILRIICSLLFFIAITSGDHQEINEDGNTSPELKSFFKSLFEAKSDLKWIENAQDILQNVDQHTKLENNKYSKFRAVPIIPENRYEYNNTPYNKIGDNQYSIYNEDPSRMKRDDSNNEKDYKTVMLHKKGNKRPVVFENTPQINENISKATMTDSANLRHFEVKSKYVNPDSLLGIQSMIDDNKVQKYNEEKIKYNENKKLLSQMQYLQDPSLNLKEELRSIPNKREEHAEIKPFIFDMGHAKVNQNEETDLKIPEKTNKNYPLIERTEIISKDVFPNLKSHSTKVKHRKSNNIYQQQKSKAEILHPMIMDYQIPDEMKNSQEEAKKLMDVDKEFNERNEPEPNAPLEFQNDQVEDSKLVYEDQGTNEDEENIYRGIIYRTRNLMEYKDDANYDDKYNIKKRNNNFLRDLSYYYPNGQIPKKSVKFKTRGKSFNKYNHQYKFRKMYNNDIYGPRMKKNVKFSQRNQRDIKNIFGIGQEYNYFDDYDGQTTAIPFLYEDEDLSTMEHIKSPVKNIEESFEKRNLRQQEEEEECEDETTSAPEEIDEGCEEETGNEESTKNNNDVVVDKKILENDERESSDKQVQSNNDQAIKNYKKTTTVSSSDLQSLCRNTTTEISTVTTQEVPPREFPKEDSTPNPVEHPEAHHSEHAEDKSEVHTTANSANKTAENTDHLGNHTKIKSDEKTVENSDNDASGHITDTHTQNQTEYSSENSEGKTTTLSGQNDESTTEYTGNTTASHTEEHNNREHSQDKSTEHPEGTTLGQQTNESSEEGSTKNVLEHSTEHEISTQVTGEVTVKSGEICIGGTAKHSENGTGGTEGHKEQQSTENSQNNQGTTTESTAQNSEGNVNQGEQFSKNCESDSSTEELGVDCVYQNSPQKKKYSSFYKKFGRKHRRNRPFNRRWHPKSIFDKRRRKHNKFRNYSRKFLRDSHNQRTKRNLKHRNNFEYYIEKRDTNEEDNKNGDQKLSAHSDQNNPELNSALTGETASNLVHRVKQEIEKKTKLKEQIYSSLVRKSAIPVYSLQSHRDKLMQAANRHMEEAMQRIKLLINDMVNEQIASRMCVYVEPEVLSYLSWLTIPGLQNNKTSKENEQNILNLSESSTKKTNFLFENQGNRSETTQNMNKNSSLQITKTNLESKKTIIKDLMKKFQKLSDPEKERYHFIRKFLDKKWNILNSMYDTIKSSPESIREIHEKTRSNNNNKYMENNNSQKSMNPESKQSESHEDITQKSSNMFSFITDWFRGKKEKGNNDNFSDEKNVKRNVVRLLPKSKVVDNENEEENLFFHFEGVS